MKNETFKKRSMSVTGKRSHIEEIINYLFENRIAQTRSTIR